MDIFAHSVWTAIAAKEYNDAPKKDSQDKKVPIITAAFWGIFPDLLAFGIPFIVLLFSLLSGTLPWHSLASLRTSTTILGGNTAWISGFISHAYQLGHSLIIFSAVFFVVWLLQKRPPLAMLGWTFHILIDIFSHSAQFFPTPFLWPISDWKFLHGISWASPWFMIINYVLLLVVFCLTFLKKKSVH